MCQHCKTDHLVLSHGSFFGNFYVPAAQRPSLPPGGRICMRITLNVSCTRLFALIPALAAPQPDNINSRTAAMGVYVRSFNGDASQAPVPVNTDYMLLQMTGSTVNPPGSYWGIWTLARTGSVYDGVAVGGYLTSWLADR